jgi:ABC-type lipoprotein export system ATPase subunit
MMLQAQGLSYSYDTQNSISLPDFQCQKGDRLLILGNSGSGKTTLLNLIGGLLRIQKGSITINGQELKSLNNNQLDAYRGKNIGLIFQKSHFVQSLNVLENLLLAQQLAGVPADKARAMHLLKSLNIEGKALKKPSSLSVGEQQRASIARALINKPALVLADEPTSALDDYHCMEVIRLLETAVKEESSTLLIVTHDQRLKDQFPNQIAL